LAVPRFSAGASPHVRATVRVSRARDAVPQALGAVCQYVMCGVWQNATLILRYLIQYLLNSFANMSMTFTLTGKSIVLAANFFPAVGRR